MADDVYTAFTGSIPENYDRYLGPMFFAGCAADLAERVAGAATGAVLEVAAGTGIASRALRDRLPAEVPLTVTDLNPDMLAVARRKFGEGEAVDFRTADAMALPFGDGAFQVVASQFGIMFCPDRVQALREMHRVLPSGGRVVFSVWDALESNPLPLVVNELMAELFRGEPPGFMQVPFSYHDEGRITADVGAAGGEVLEIHSLSGECRFPDPRHAALGMVTGSPLSAEIEQLGAVPVDDVVARLAARLAEQFGERDCRVPMSWKVVVTTAA